MRSVIGAVSSAAMTGVVEQVTDAPWWQDLGMAVLSAVIAAVATWLTSRKRT